MEKTCEICLGRGYVNVWIKNKQVQQSCVCCTGILIEEREVIQRLLYIFAYLIDGVTVKELIDLTGYSEEKIRSLLDEYQKISDNYWGKETKK